MAEFHVEAEEESSVLDDVNKAKPNVYSKHANETELIENNEFDNISMLEKSELQKVGDQSSVLNDANKVKEKLFCEHANETRHNKNNNVFDNVAMLDT